MSVNCDERVLDEVEALKAILLDELLVRTNENDVPISIETVLFPSTADDTMQQYVRVTLVVELTRDYPDALPIVRLKNPRGLDDAVLSKIEQEVRVKCEEFLGQPVIYELIELVKEHLTASNLPCCPCVICLYGFREGDHFTKTECYHYFHSHCLACHVTSTERFFKEEQDKLPAWQRQQQNAFQVLCPVCREPISCDMELLSQAPPPHDVENAKQFELDDELRTLQQKMADLFSYQKQRGGIIDPEAEESKLVLVTDTRVEEDPPGPSIPFPSYLPNLETGNVERSRDWRRSRGFQHPRGRGFYRGRKQQARQSQTPTSR